MIVLLNDHGYLPSHKQKATHLQTTLPKVTPLQTTPPPTNVHTTLLEHTSGGIVEVCEDDSHLLVHGRQVRLPFPQLLLQLGLLFEQFFSRQPFFKVTTYGIESVHGLAEVLEAELDLHRPLRLQDAPSIKCNIVQCRGMSL